MAGAMVFNQDEEQEDQEAPKSPISHICVCVYIYRYIDVCVYNMHLKLTPTLEINYTSVENVSNKNKWKSGWTNKTWKG